MQGAAAAKVAFGLFKQDGELVACVTAGPARFSKLGNWELIRFATKKNLVIVGGFSKLIDELTKKLTREFDVHVLESFVDRRIFSGHSLHSAGWSKIRTTSPGYCWLFNGARISRSRTQKNRLKGLLGEAFDPALSEAENMFRVGASRLWDCGQHVFRLNLD